MIWAQDEPPVPDAWHSNSPDGLFLAAIRRIPDEVLVWRLDLDTTRLMVVRTDTDPHKEPYVSYDIPRLIDHIAWSPDSKFLVMTTYSAGGHSPWHDMSYVYCVDDKSLRYMDDIIGLVVDDKFKFVGPHTVAMKIPGPSRPEMEIDFEHPKLVVVDLVKQTQSMKKQGGMKEGKVWDRQ